MKKYIKPTVITRNVSTPVILAGSIEDVKGDYDGSLQLKSKDAPFVDTVFDFEADY